MKRFGYYALVLLTSPFLWVALVVALVEILFNGDGHVASWVVSPFTWAIRRGRIPEWKRKPPVPSHMQFNLPALSSQLNGQKIRIKDRGQGEKPIDIVISVGDKDDRIGNRAPGASYTIGAASNCVWLTADPESNTWVVHDDKDVTRKDPQQS